MNPIPRTGCISDMLFSGTFLWLLFDFELDKVQVSFFRENPPHVANLSPHQRVPPRTQGSSPGAGANQRAGTRGRPGERSRVFYRM